MKSIINKKEYEEERMGEKEQECEGTTETI